MSKKDKTVVEKAQERGQVIDSFIKLPLDVQNAFRTLRTNIQFMGVDQPIKTIAITSATPASGKSTLSLMLGMASAEAGKRTLVIDCDCRRPVLGARLGLHPQKTWFDILCNDATVEEVAVHTKQPNLDFIDSEPQVLRSGELIASKRFETMIEEFRTLYDFIIFDTPPLGAFIEAAVLAANVDGTLIAIHAGKVSLQQQKSIIEQLKTANARVLGAVLNGVKYNKHNDYYYYYYKDGRRSRRYKRK